MEAASVRSARASIQSVDPYLLWRFAAETGGEIRNRAAPALSGAPSPEASSTQQPASHVKIVFLRKNTGTVVPT